ncbi:MAG TPA: hypothetical protein PLR44_14230 [Thermomicrobiales bacterium]|nr:hypothetical protein [Thermomicrobiales bacterium]HRA32893.1 hypothetical protein [Thermomicrobiales bacterium]
MARKWVQCPTCRGEGITDDGECPECGGAGKLDDGYTYTRHSWIHLPGSGTWINPAHVVYIVPNGTPGTLNVGYTLILTTEGEVELSGFSYPDDVDRLTAWLEARS